MNPASEDIKDLITQSDGVGTFGVDVFIGDEPSQPDLCVTIYDDGGLAPDLATDLEFLNVRVEVRGAANGYKATYNKIERIRNLLHGDHQRQVPDGTRYLLIAAMSDPAYVRQDERNRPMFSIDFQVTRT